MLRETYIKLCKKHGQKEIEALPWSYNFYNNKKIAIEHRLFYRYNPTIKKRFKKPFNANHQPSFCDVINDKKAVNASVRKTKKHVLLEHAKDAYKKGGLSNVIEKTLNHLKCR